MKEVAKLQGEVGGWRASAGRVGRAMLPAARAAAEAARGAAERAVALSSPSSQGSASAPRTPVRSTDGNGTTTPGMDVRGASPRARRMAAHS